MFIYFGTEHNKHVVYDSDDREKQEYTDADLKYALSLGIKIEFLDAQKMHYESWIMDIYPVTHSLKDNIIVIDAMERGGAYGLTHRYYMYNLNNGVKTVLLSVPHVLYGELVRCNGVQYNGYGYDYEFYVEEKVEDPEQIQLIGNVARLTARGTITEGGVECLESEFVFLGRVN